MTARLTPPGISDRACYAGDSCQRDGGDFNKVKLIPNDITDEPAALAAHQTDAIWYSTAGRNQCKTENTDCDFFFFKDINRYLITTHR